MASYRQIPRRRPQLARASTAPTISTTAVPQKPPTIATVTTTDPPGPKPPFLPSEVINLIIAHYIGPYTLHISHAHWDQDSPLRLHNTPDISPLTLVSHTFATIVRHQLLVAFTGRLRIDHDAAANMQYYVRPSDSSAHMNWLFDRVHTVQIVGLPNHAGVAALQAANYASAAIAAAARMRPYVVDLKHWPELKVLEVLVRVSLLAYLREITEEQHDEEVLRIAGGIWEGFRIENKPEGRAVSVTFVFESCRCGRLCLVGVGEAGKLEVLHVRPEV